jgi:hypothetical protein
MWKPCAKPSTKYRAGPHGVLVGTNFVDLERHLTVLAHAGNRLSLPRSRNEQGTQG